MSCLYFIAYWQLDRIVKLLTSFFCCAPINISILCAIQCCTLDILPIYLTCSLTNVCLCVFVLAIPTTTPPVTTGRPDYCGTVPTVVSWRCWLLFFCVLWRYATACGVWQTASGVCEVSGGANNWEMVHFNYFMLFKWTVSWESIFETIIILPTWFQNVPF